MEKEIENLIEELTKVRPSMLNEEALKLFNTIMVILDERDKLIKENKELEENNEQLEKWLNYYKLGNTAEEFENLFGNTPINDIEKIKKYIFQNYIPKSKIKEKIEELEAKKKEYGFGSIESIIFLNKIQVLQELMEDK